jgi:hypothetical protein
MRAQGAIIITDPNLARPREADTFTCGHCQCVVAMHDLATGARKDANHIGIRCSACSAMICRSCSSELAKTLKCEPFERRLEAMESRARLRAAIGG